MYYADYDETVPLSLNMDKVCMYVLAELFLYHKHGQFVWIVHNWPPHFIPKVFYLTIFYRMKLVNKIFEPSFEFFEL